MNPSCIDLFITNSPLSFQNTIVVSNGLSDFHKVVITVMKMSFKKHSPIERHCKDYKYFDQTEFVINLNEKLSENISNYESCETTFIEVLKKHPSLRKIFLRANHAAYITKSLRKTIMRRSQLATKYLKAKTQTDLKLYKNIQNYVISYTRGKYYESLDMKNLLDSKQFWKTMRPFLSDKNAVFSQISIEKNNRIISGDFEFSTFLKMHRGRSM